MKIRIQKHNRPKSFLSTGYDALPRPGFFSLAFLLLQFFYFILFIDAGIEGYSFTVRSISVMLLSFMTLFLFTCIIDILSVHRLIRRFVFFVILFTAWGLYSYHLAIKSPLDYVFATDNVGLVFSIESFKIMASVYRINDFMILALLAVLSGFLEFRFTLFSRKAERPRTVASFFIALILWVFALIAPVASYDEFTQFAKSGIDLHLENRATGTVSGYPYMKKVISHTQIRSVVPGEKRDAPNIFLIMVESFNANFVENRSPDGMEYTPYFNSIIPKGVYVDRFYGNSVQTAKGHASALFSIIPSTHGKIYVDYPDLSIEGFPAILARHKYETIFFQAYHDLNFDNTKPNMIKAGFSAVKSYYELRRTEDKPYTWGWGVEDRVFYERFFEYLDSEHARNPQAPVFAALATVGSHIPCDGMPANEMEIFKNPKTLREKYSNAIHLSDKQLARFFELLHSRKYLENSIVIITGDHSFPMSEHGIYNNEICFYDETFRIPFLMIWEGALEPERVKGHVYSQIDIGPTIMDLLGIRREENTMLGISIFDRTTQHPAYLVQPYNGGFLETVQYPYKFVRHVKTGNEYLFDLAKDPDEKMNLVGSFDQNKVGKMRSSLDTILINQKLIEENHVRK